MSDYEHIVISAVRYALGRMTYIVELTVNYIMKQIDEDKLSEMDQTSSAGQERTGETEENILWIQTQAFFCSTAV